MFEILFLATLLVATYVTGSRIESRHVASLAAREQAAREHLAITLPSLPTGREVEAAALVSGSVVVSLDYFKRFVSGIRQLFGGRLRAFEPLLERARREALLRMREDAIGRGFDVVVNVRLETSRIASSNQRGEGTVGVEVFAYGTALKFGR